ncbi:uncharacterized protein ELE39_002464 [Cryptosporidium sp. chipmunk genotype I]|uniref:uncharacterized protein n=1 Tax=Cryptosporidium sp. chipmunk genotype I TaxID=1280935 RepID=UPI003519F54C|nr:transmembrane protein [Cryptosporidium sp. chipmunk genotype I]
MASSLLENDVIDQSVLDTVKNKLSLRKKSGKRPKSLSKLRNGELEKQQNDKKRHHPTKSVMMDSEDEDLTDEELNEYEEELNNFDYLKVFRIPLMLFILSLISVVFVDLFGKNYVRNELENGIYNMVDPNYGSFIWNFSGK